MNAPLRTDPFDELFVLEMAGNHLGSVERGLKIIDAYSKIVRFNNVKAGIKLQFRDIDSIIHRDFREAKHIRYIRRSQETQLTLEELHKLVTAIRQGGCIPMTTPFDEKSVDLCQELDIKIIKIASSDINDWILIEKIAKTRKPVIVSTGGSSMKDTDDLVTFFENRNIPLALNHCVSIYPSEDHELELNQIDFLLSRYPGHTIGLSTHEYHHWDHSMMIAYAKGARLFERHIDIDDGNPITPYSSLPHQIDVWFKAYKKAKEMCGAPGNRKRLPPQKEVEHLNTFVRGVYAKTNLRAGDVLNQDNIYLAVPLVKGQISCRELMWGEVLLHDCPKDAPIFIDSIDSPYAHNEELKALMYERGVISATEQSTVYRALAEKRNASNVPTQ